MYASVYSCVLLVSREWIRLKNSRKLLMRKWNIYYERANCLGHRGRFKSIWNSRPGIEDAARGAKTPRKLPRSSGLAVFTSEIDIICYYNSIKFALFRPHRIIYFFISGWPFWDPSVYHVLASKILSFFSSFIIFFLSKISKNNLV